MSLGGFGNTATLRLLGIYPATADNPRFAALVGLHDCRCDMDRAPIARIQMNQLRDKFFTSHDDGRLGTGTAGSHRDINPILTYTAN
ncbi:MAG: hypothetical protein U1E67_11955 [Hyphomicrobiales bacterium]